MPRGDKSAYTEKQKRKAGHIEESMEERGVSAKTAARRAWATVNKQDGGGLKKRSSRATPARKSGRKQTSGSTTGASSLRKTTTSRSPARSSTTRRKSR